MVSNSRLVFMAILLLFLVVSADTLRLSTKLWPQSHTDLLACAFAPQLHVGHLFDKAGILYTKLLQTLGNSLYVTPLRKTGQAIG